MWERDRERELECCWVLSSCSISFYEFPIVANIRMFSHISFSDEQIQQSSRRPFKREIRFLVISSCQALHNINVPAEDGGRKIAQKIE